MNSLYDLLGELERFEIAHAETLYQALPCPKRLESFTVAEGAGAHCEALARSPYHQRVFDYLDETLARAERMMSQVPRPTDLTVSVV